MRIGLVIPTHKRATIVREFLRSIQHQIRLPDEVVLSVVEQSDLPDLTSFGFPIKVILGQAGSCIQRNKGIEYLAGRVDIVLFLDDDFLMANNYLDELIHLFASNNSIVGVTGKVIADGARSVGFSFAQAEVILNNYKPQFDGKNLAITDVSDAYGCNMAFRLSSIGVIKFDERLPFYGWQEDVDFSAQIRRKGRIVKANAVWGVHLGTKMGKTSGLRFGYSQMINPLFVSRKGNMAPYRAVTLILRNLIANTFKSVFPEPYIDRRGRLVGNLKGLYHILQGRLDPTYILQI